MGDIRVDDGDLRKQSAKNLQRRNQMKKKRGFWRFCFDLIIKSLLLTLLLATDFALFANAGNYSIFTTLGSINIEAVLIFAGIGALSLAIMLLSMILLPLDNVVLAAAFGAMGVALINQFATFDKNSLLLILFGEGLSDDVNVLLYKYSALIIGGVLFLIFYVLFKVLSKKLMLGLTLVMAGLCGWALSVSYFDSGRPIFRKVSDRPLSINNETEGQNLVFLAFNRMTSPNNLADLQTSQAAINAEKAFNNALGFYADNKFKLYPNAVIDRNRSAAENLFAMYNPENPDSAGNSAVVAKDSYFDLSRLHSEVAYLSKSSLMAGLKKQGFDINVYQVSDIGICHLSEVGNCVEKVAYPLAFPSDRVTLKDRVIVLAAQWVVSMGVVDSVNPLLGVIRYVADVKPYNFEATEVDVINSLNMLDMITTDISRKGGKQAYFAVVDFPSETFLYDEHCDMKIFEQWNSSKTAYVSLTTRQNSYLEQSSCLYGYLQKFIKQLDSIDEGNTTLIIAGISNPTELISMAKSDNLYQTIKPQLSGLAIRSPKSKIFAADYSVCTTAQLLDAYFNNRKGCREFAFVKESDKKINAAKAEAAQAKFSDDIISKAKAAFKTWFSGWAHANGYKESIGRPVEIKAASAVMPEDEATAAAPAAEEIVEDARMPQSAEMPQVNQSEAEEVLNAPETEAADDEPVLVDAAGEVIPETLFDNGLDPKFKVEEVKEVIKEEAAASAINDMPAMVEELPEIPSNLENMAAAASGSAEAGEAPAAEPKTVDNDDDTAPTILVPLTTTTPEPEVDNPKQGYDLNAAILEAKRKAQMSAQELASEKAEQVAKQQAEALQNIGDKAERVNETVKQQTQSLNEAKAAAAAAKKAAEDKAAAEAEKQKEELKKILVAPQTNGQKLSPEELKKQYHKMLSEGYNK
ncbi:MAG: hypothetical protein IJ184_03255 [Alphaproteobacteria bacterium]|nr:hypothetical protein [Alphaproteobacteria bacterium]